MERATLAWFQWMYDNNLISTWQNFLHALKVHFAPSHYEDLKGALFKLCQTSTMRKYQNQFESLANRIVGQAHPFLLSCFISGLKPEIQREVHAFQLILLSQAVSLAKLQEEKFVEASTSNCYVCPSHSIAKTLMFVNTFSPNTQTTSHSSQKTKSDLNPLAIKRLSPVELQSLHEKILCHYCDEHYRPGHKCKWEFMLLIAEPSDPETKEIDLNNLLHIKDPMPNELGPIDLSNTNLTQIS